jgi:rod shape-determining protein MreD
VTSRRALRGALVILGVLLVQSTVGLDISIAGVHPELVYLVPVAAALVEGPEAGTVYGFAAGIAADLLLPTPFGLTALVACLLGYSVGRATQSADKTLWWLAPVVAFLGSATAVMLYAVLGAILGQDEMLKVNLGAVIGVVGVTNALLALASVRLMRWTLGAGSRSTTLATGARW